ERPLFWAYLGDIADLACAGELDRGLDVLGDFAPKPGVADAQLGGLAGFALGNHEMSFMGSFHWSPYWDSACRSALGIDDARRPAGGVPIRAPVEAAHEAH